MRKIVSVEPLKNYWLLLEFDNGEKRLYNMEKELDGVFEYLKDDNNFESVVLVRGALTWFRPNAMEIDLCSDSVYMDSTHYTGRP